jgi:hypothetical protein
MLLITNASVCIYLVIASYYDAAQKWLKKEWFGTTLN